MKTFWGYVKEGRLQAFFFGSSPPRAFSIANRLYRADNRLTPTDSAILACFLCDDLAQNFFTTDQEILLNLRLRKRIHEGWPGKAINPLP